MPVEHDSLEYRLKRTLAEINSRLNNPSHWTDGEISILKEEYNLKKKKLEQLNNLKI